jgi:hypothetical protein
MDDRSEPGGAPAASRSPASPTDEALGALVRQVATDWTMPPRGVHDVTWQDRVDGRVRQRGARGTRAGRGGWARGFGARVAAAFSVAVTGAILLALLAVMLRSPSTSPSAIVGGSALPSSPSSIAGSPSPSHQSAPPSVSAGPSGPIGGVVQPGRYLPLRSANRVDILDLQTGSVTTVARRVGDLETVLIRPDGTLVCVCEVPHALNLGPGKVELAHEARLLAADGSLIDAWPLNVIDADPGSGSSGTLGQDHPAIVSTASLSDDGSLVLVGTSYRTPSAWRSTIEVVDLTKPLSHTLPRSSLVAPEPLQLPDVPIPPGEGRDADPPRISVSPHGSSIAIRLRTYTSFGPEPWLRWTAPLAGASIGVLTPLATGVGTLFDSLCDDPYIEDFATDESYYALCFRSGPTISHVVLRRVHLDGSPIGDTPLDEVAAGGLWGIGFAVDRNAGTWYLWNPIERKVASVSLTTGEVVSIRSIAVPTASSGGDDWLGTLGRSIGRWIAPSTTAKIDLQPSLALSPDGTRLYALAVLGDSQAGDELLRPAGVLVIDSASLAMLDHWPPVADYWSLAVSGDGSRVYAAGLPGVDAEGKTSPAIESSVTVHAAQDGRVLMRAATLGGLQEYQFPASTLP